MSMAEFTEKMTEAKNALWSGNFDRGASILDDLLLDLKANNIQVQGPYTQWEDQVRAHFAAIAG